MTSRNLLSRGRRRILAFSFVVLGLALNALLYLSLSTGDWTWQNDFAAYYRAAERMVAGVLPYATEQLSGAYEAIGPEHYLYPPFFAQVLAPVTSIPSDVAKALWLVGCFGTAFLGTWLAAGVGGAPRGPDRTLWSLAATLLFPPVVLAAWQGNVGTILGVAIVLIAMGGTVAGAAAGIGLLPKVVPGALAPAVFFESRRSAVALILAIASLATMGFVLAPSAWMDYPTVLLNMLAGGVEHVRNIAPDRIASGAGLAEPISTLLRATAIAGGLGFILASVWAARRPGGMPLAALLGSVGMLLIPGTLWYHYLAVLLPFAAMAWPSATAWTRVFLIVGAVLVAIGFVVGGSVVLAGTVMLMAAAAFGLRSRPDGTLLGAVERGGEQRRA